MKLQGKAVFGPCSRFLALRPSPAALMLLLIVAQALAGQVSGLQAAAHTQQGRRLSWQEVGETGELLPLGELHIKHRRTVLLA